MVRGESIFASRLLSCDSGRHETESQLDSQSDQQEYQEDGIPFRFVRQNQNKITLEMPVEPSTEESEARTFYQWIYHLMALEVTMFKLKDKHRVCIPIQVCI